MKKILLAVICDDYFTKLHDLLISSGYLVIWTTSFLELSSTLQQQSDAGLLILMAGLPGLNDLGDINLHLNIGIRKIPVILLMTKVDIHSLKLADLMEFSEIIKYPIDFEPFEKILRSYFNDNN